MREADNRRKNSAKRLDDGRSKFTVVIPNHRKKLTNPCTILVGVIDGGKVTSMIVAYTTIDKCKHDTNVNYKCK